MTLALSHQQLLSGNNSTLMKTSFLFLLFVFVAQIATAQFNFRQHKIIAGDDVYSIAKEYGTTPEAIYKLNPTAEKGIQPGQTLVIPNVIEVPELPVEGVVFDKHKVKKKQTLYSISKKYNVSIDDIKKYNDFVATDGLKKGDILKIPFPAPKIKKVFKNLNEGKKAVDTIHKEKLKTQIYTVKPKETHYGIARKFGITVSELENMNPNLGVNFPVGVQILVPEKIAIKDGKISDDLMFYRVPPKQTLYSLSKEFKISVDSITKLNPEIKEGLKADMVIKVPNSGFSTSLKKEDLFSNLINLKHKKIAILLPFNVMDFSQDPEQYKEYLKKSKVARLVVDFYSGTLMALEKIKSLGVDIGVTVEDTQKKKNIIEQLVKNKKLDSYDAIIGPLYNKNVEKLASLLSNSSTPVFSPISNKVVVANPNFYQTLPSSDVLQKRMINYVSKDTLERRIVVIADNEHYLHKQKLLKAFPNAKVLNPIDNNFINEEKLLKIIGEEKSELKNHVFLESSNLLLVSNVTSLLNARAKTHKITLFTTDKTAVYDNEAVSNVSLSNLNFHYPSTNKIEENTNSLFFVNYKNKYGTEPNSYAIRGYDLMYDVVLRLCASLKITDLNDLDLETEYIENKFNYKKNNKGGIENKASYIVKYSPGLHFEVVN